MQYHVQQQGVIIGRLQRGDDLLGALTAICREHGVLLGRISAIGAVETARLGYYDQQKRAYEYHTTEASEILTCVGNVSLRDGVPFIHAHLTVGERDGRALGGHLMDGTVVFACEYTIDILTGAELHRGYDETTGLPLWQE